MKNKLFMASMVALSTFALVGCSQKPASNPTPSTTQTPAVSQEIVAPKNDQSSLGLLMRSDKIIVVLKDGTFKPLDQDVTLLNGTRIMKDGKIVYPAEKTMKKDPETDRKNMLSNYSFAMPDGSIMWQDGNTLPDGTFVWTSGNTWLHDGTESSNTVTRPDGISIWEDGSITQDGEDTIIADAAGKTLKDGSIVTSDGVANTEVKRPDGILMMPNKGVKFPDGTMVSNVDGKITRGDGTVLFDGTVVFSDGIKIDVWGNANVVKDTFGPLMVTRDGKTVLLEE